MSVKVFPSVNNLDGGKTITEIDFAAMQALWTGSFVVSGFTVPATSIDLDLAVAVGICVIDGYYVETDAVMTSSSTASNTNHVYLQLTFDVNSKVDGVQIVTNITGAAPTSSVKLATATAGGSTISATTNARRLPPFGVAGHTHNGAVGNGPVIDAGTVDGIHGAGFLGVTATAADSHLLDGLHGVSYATSAQGAIVSAATDAATPSTLAKRDVQGAIAFSTVYGNLTGKLDGITSTSFVRSDVDDIVLGDLNFTQDDKGIFCNNHADHRLVSGYHDTDWTLPAFLEYKYVTGGWELTTPAGVPITHNGITMWDSGNDGSGSGLDADKLSGITSTCFVRSDVDDTVAGDLQFVTANKGIFCNDHANHKLVSGYHTTDWTLPAYVEYKYLTGGWELTTPAGVPITHNGVTMWDAGNDGTGSGLDADLLEGYHGDVSATGNTVMFRNVGANTAVNDITTHDGAVHSASDLRLKNKHGDFLRGLAEVLTLKPYSYSYKEDNPKSLPHLVTQVGLSAQDVMTVIPEAVETDADGFLNMTQGPIFYALINAVKELAAQNVDLAAQVKSLAERIDKLENK